MCWTNADQPESFDLTCLLFVLRQVQPMISMPCRSSFVWKLWPYQNLGIVTNTFRQHSTANHVEFVPMDELVESLYLYLKNRGPCIWRGHHLFERTKAAQWLCPDTFRSFSYRRRNLTRVGFQGPELNTNTRTNAMTVELRMFFQAKHTTFTELSKSKHCLAELQGHSRPCYSGYFLLGHWVSPSRTRHDAVEV